MTTTPGKRVAATLLKCGTWRDTERMQVARYLPELVDAEIEAVKRAAQSALTSARDELNRLRDHYHKNTGKYGDYSLEPDDSVLSTLNALTLDVTFLQSAPTPEAETLRELLEAIKPVIPDGWDDGYWQDRDTVHVPGVTFGHLRRLEKAIAALRGRSETG